MSCLQHIHSFLFQAKTRTRSKREKKERKNKSFSSEFLASCRIVLRIEFSSFGSMCLCVFPFMALPVAGQFPSSNLVVDSFAHSFASIKVRLCRFLSISFSPFPFPSLRNENRLPNQRKNTRKLHMWRMRWKNNAILFSKLYVNLRYIDLQKVRIIELQPGSRVFSPFSPSLCLYLSLCHSFPLSCFPIVTECLVLFPCVSLLEQFDLRKISRIFSRTNYQRCYLNFSHFENLRTNNTLNLMLLFEIVSSEWFVLKDAIRNETLHLSHLLTELFKIPPPHSLDPFR